MTDKISSVHTSYLNINSDEFSRLVENLALVKASKLQKLNNSYSVGQWEDLSITFSFSEIGGLEIVYIGAIKKRFDRIESLSEDLSIKHLLILMGVYLSHRDTGVSIIFTEAEQWNWAKTKPQYLGAYRSETFQDSDYPIVYLGEGKFLTQKDLRVLNRLACQ